MLWWVFPLLLFGGDKNNTIGCSYTIDGRRGILQNLDGFDVARIQTGKS